MLLAPITSSDPRPTYVSLGDSYSSGMGSEATPTANGTLVDRRVYAGSGESYRSTRSAAHLVARDEGFDLHDVSYAGATTNTVLRTGQGSEPAQIAAVGADTDVVTLTIGGNDVDLLSLVQAVYRSEVTTDSLAARQTMQLTRGLQAKVYRVLDAITSRAPHAQVRIAGYPYLFPKVGQPARLCATYLSAGEQALMERLQDGVNDAIRGAAQLAGPNVRYVNPEAPDSPFTAVDAFGAGDAGSASPARWINGEADYSAHAFPMHPNTRGYEFYAQLYEASLAR